MSKLFSLLTIAFICFSFINTDGEKEESTLVIELQQIRSNAGIIHVFLYNYENQYPENPYLNFEVNKKDLVEGKLLLTIPNLTPGKYAISVLDDENANDDLDMFLGIPTEGYGFSNNIKPFLSMPEFNDILFEIPKNASNIKLNLQYLI